MTIKRFFDDLTMFAVLLALLGPMVWQEVRAAQPPAYAPATDFSAQSFDNNILPQIDAELDALKATLDVMRANLAIIQRDDTALNNNTVHPNSLTPSTLAIIAAGLNGRGAWASGASYAAGDVITNGSGTYLALSAHTSGTFATDLGNNLWMVLENAVTLQDAALTAGSGTAYTLDFDPDYADLADVPPMLVKWHTSSTGSATLQIDALTAKAIQIGGAAVGSGDLARFDFIVYNGAADAFHVIGRDTAPAGTAAADLWQIGDLRITGRASVATGWLFVDGRTMGNVGDSCDIESADYESLHAVVKTWDCNAGTEVWDTDCVTLCDVSGTALAAVDDLGASAVNNWTQPDASDVGYKNTNSGSGGRAGGWQTVTLTTTELAAHTHTTVAGGNHNHANVPGYNQGEMNDGGSSPISFDLDASYVTGNQGSHAHTVNSAGSGAAFNKSQPTSFWHVEVKYQ